MSLEGHSTQLAGTSTSITWEPLSLILPVILGINIMRGYVSADAFHDSSNRFPPPKCSAGARVHVQLILLKWAVNSEKSLRTMWLSGPARAGKSAVAQMMAEEWDADGRLAGAFFFARWRAEGDTWDRLFTTIAFQLAINVPRLRQAIGMAVDLNPTILEKNLGAQANALLVMAMKALDPRPSSPFVVVIDGLDECKERHIQQTILDTVLHLSNVHDLPLRFLVA
ncbi:hypothetical protein DFH09DRAFT_984479 [Mycena vulgaris]|nr:hypothetical protein DFH09DRAFT_984479 [Mycena vulgaris]